MSLRDDILADPACSAARTARDCVEMARIRSLAATRTRPNGREIGNGSILETIGVASGNKLLDEINSNTLYRYVKPLVDQGRLLIGSPLVAGTLLSMVPAIITQAEADRLVALGKDPWPYSAIEVADALYNADGSAK
ncbi:MAG: hypothetical protein JWQ01_4870 [Massilia sp.]|nr:hypothetical protein [Massilia sp.]